MATSRVYKLRMNVFCVAQWSAVSGIYKTNRQAKFVDDNLQLVLAADQPESVCPRKLEG